MRGAAAFVDRGRRVKVNVEEVLERVSLSSGRVLRPLTK